MNFQIPDDRQCIVFWLDIEQTLALAGEEDNQSLIQSARDIPAKRYAGFVLSVRRSNVQ